MSLTHFLMHIYTMPCNGTCSWHSIAVLALGTASMLEASLDNIVVEGIDWQYVMVYLREARFNMMLLSSPGMCCTFCKYRCINQYPMHLDHCKHNNWSMQAVRPQIDRGRLQPKARPSEAGLHRLPATARHRCAGRCPQQNISEGFASRLRLKQRVFQKRGMQSQLTVLTVTPIHPQTVCRIGCTVHRNRRCPRGPGPFRPAPVCERRLPGISAQAARLEGSLRPLPAGEAGLAN
jgi:hypothetical protein